MRKQVLIAAAALGLGGLIAQLYVATQTYRPVVRVEGPDGVAYTAILSATRERPDCGAASERFLEPIRAACPECRIAFARCVRQGDGLAASVMEGAKGPHAVVRMPGVSIAIDGAGDAERRDCELIANGVQRLGVPGARCIAEPVSALPQRDASAIAVRLRGS